MWTSAQVTSRLAAMRAAGLEAALIDNAPHLVAALDPADGRTRTIAVAGPAALLVAKLHKLGERTSGTAGRLRNKDASDLFLLLRETETAALVRTLRQLRGSAEAGEAVETALGHLRTLFGSSAGTGIPLLRAAVAGIEDEETVAQSCIALAMDLLDALS